MIKWILSIIGGFLIIISLFVPVTMGQNMDTVYYFIGYRKIKLYGGGGAIYAGFVEGTALIFSLIVFLFLLIGAILAIWTGLKGLGEKSEFSRNLILISIVIILFAVVLYPLGIGPLTEPTLDGGFDWKYFDLSVGLILSYIGAALIIIAALLPTD